MPFHPYQYFKRRALRAPRAEIGKVIVGDIAAHQQTARPCAGEICPEVACVEICKFNVSPIMQTFSFGSIAGRQALPGSIIKLHRYFMRSPADCQSFAPRHEAVGAVDTQHIALAGLTQCHLDLTDPVHTIRRPPTRMGSSLATARSISWRARVGLVANSTPAGTCAFFQPLRIVCPRLRHRASYRQSTAEIVGTLSNIFVTKIARTALQRLWADRFVMRSSPRSERGQRIQRQGRHSLTCHELWQTVGHVCDLFTDEECYNFVMAAGYSTD